MRPMALLIVAFFALAKLYELATEFPDVPREIEGDEAMGMLMILLLFGCMTGAGLLVSESNDGTLGFLDGLPVSRTRVFFAKILAGVAVIALVPLLELADDTFTQAIMRQSTDAPFPWDHLWVGALGQSAVAFYILAGAALLSFARRWFALAIGFVFWGFLWLRLNNVAWIELFDPYALLAYGTQDEVVWIPWRQIATVSGVGAVLLGFSWLGFLGLGDRARRSRLLGALLRFAGFVLLPVVWIGAMYNFSKVVSVEPARSAGNPTGDAAFGHTTTKRYEFLFRESQRKQAQKLIAEADSIHDQVTGFLGAAPMPERIVVDLGSPVLEHFAGLTNWTKIRMPLTTTRVGLAAVLGHETTHVYIDQLSDGVLARKPNSARFFHEGLATYVEQKFFCTPEERAAMRRAAAAAQVRGKVSFELLADDAALEKKRDGLLVYPLGEVFCEALVTSYGNGAPGKLLRAIGRSGAPAGLKGTALWRDAMQACGFNLERVLAEDEASLDRAEKEEAGFLATLPRLTGRVEVVGGEIVIHAQYQGKAPGPLVVMLPQSMGLNILTADKNGEVRVPRSRYPGPSLRYALGWTVERMPWPVFEEWAEAGVGNDK